MAKRNIIELTRYTLDTVSGMVVIFVIFCIMFFGAQAIVAPGSREATLAGIVVGFMVWTFALFTYQESTQELMMEAAAGTLEQLAMSPFGLLRVMGARISASMAYQFVVIGTLLVAMMAVSGKWLHLDLPSLVPLIIVTLVGVYGVGLAVGGLTLVFKRTANILSVIQFVFIALIATPLDTFPALKYAPLSWGSHLIGRVMIDEQSLVSIGTADLGFLVVHSAAWLGAGMIAFRAAENVARERALLGHY
jgi:ABC-2 type transport system permease protein